MTPFEQREMIFGPIVRKAFEAEGLPGAWGMALARRESNFRPDAQSMAEGDVRRGGSFGLCQMSLETARTELGYVGGGDGLTDPQLNAKFAARYFRILMRRFKITELRDIAAAYNSGVPFARAPRLTRTMYVPLLLSFAKEYGDPA